MKLLFTIFLFFISFQLFSQAPNFVFILSDDMGWNGTSVLMLNSESGSKSDFYETPNLEQLATDGMVFSNAYAPAAKCSPTRCSILTGQTPANNDYTDTGGGGSTGEILIGASTINSIPTADTTIAEWLNLLPSNYRSAHYGKWHLSSGGTSANGFDFGDGNTNNNDGDAGDGMTIQIDPKKITDLTDKGVAFMQTAVADNVPFYLQISHYAVHSAIETTQTSFDYFNGITPGTIHNDPEFAGMTKDLDDGIGLILNEITNLGIGNNTYVIFMSDHGASSGLSSNFPLTRGKNYLQEGGIRVPFIVKGPNISAGSSCFEPIVGYDLFPTIAELADNSFAPPASLEGQSIVPLFEQQTFTRDNPLYFHSPHYATNPGKTPASAIIEGNYKVFIDYDSGIEYLYDLDTDISESNNIASTNPAIYNSLRLKLRDYLKLVDANMPTLNPAYVNFSGTAPDIDNDGLEDEWELRELLSYTFGPTDDPDGDGSNNMEEYTNGTDPLVFDVPLAASEINSFQGFLSPLRHVNLSWENELLTQLDYYILEHSENGNNWMELSKLNSSAKEYTHSKPSIGENYYRLKLKYLNGKIDHSTIIVINVPSEDWVQLFPNPSKGILNLKFQTSYPNNVLLTIQIVNSMGQLVKQVKKEKSNLISLSIDELTQGIFAMKILYGGQVVSVKQFVHMK